MSDKFAKVFFTKNLNSSNVSKVLDKVFDTLDFTFTDNIIGIKVHTGERGNKNFIKAKYLSECLKFINKNIEKCIIECNTAYEGSRNDSDKHIQLLQDHEWSKYFSYNILDMNGDISLNIPNGNIIKKNYIGKDIKEFKQVIVISHFKAHPMGGFGGALKQLSIGFASSRGKQYIHGYGNFELGKKNIHSVNTPNQVAFIKSMADAASSVVNYFKNNIIFVNFLMNIAESCDCDANAPSPCMKDIGLLISRDPIAIDQACIDLITESDDKGKGKILKQIYDKDGMVILKAAEELGIGYRSYNFQEV